MIAAVRLLGAKSPFSDRRDEFAAGRFGIKLFLASLGMLFAASLLLYFILRVQLGATWPRDLPALPELLWLSTPVLLVSSGTIQLAVAAVQRNRKGATKLFMLATLLLGLLFLALQAICWAQWFGEVRGRWTDAAAFQFALTSFFVMTGIHAAHVLGGLIPMAFITRRAMHDRYDSDHHAGIVYCALYWHFLDVVWLILFATLLLGT